MMKSARLAAHANLGPSGLAFLLLASTVLFDLLQYYSHSLNMHQLFNADALYLPSLFDDLVKNGGTYFNWYLAPAPVFFPDMPIYFLINFVLDDIYHCIPAFFTIQLLVTTIVLYKFYTLFFNKAMSVRLAIVSVSCVELFFFHKGPFGYILLSGFHFGEFLVGLVCLYVVMKKLFRLRTSFVEIMALLIVALLTAVSDYIFIIHFILPLVITIAIASMCGLVLPKKCIGFIVAALLVSSLSLLGQKLVVPNKTLHLISFSLENIVRHIDGTHGFGTFNMLLAILYVGAAPVIWVLRKRVAALKDSCPRLFVAVIFLTANFYVTATVFYAAPQPFSGRYMIPLCFLSVFVFPIFILKKYPKLLHKGTVNLTMALIFVSACLCLPKLSALEGHYYPRYIQCLDDVSAKTGARTGIAQYWQARQITLLSKNKLSVTQVKSDLRPYHWISSRSWDRPEYDFAVIDNHAAPSYVLDRDLLEKMNGPPTSIAACDGSTILFYQKGLHPVTP